MACLSLSCKDTLEHIYTSGRYHDGSWSNNICFWLCVVIKLQYDSSFLRNTNTHNVMSTCHLSPEIFEIFYYEKQFLLFVFAQLQMFFKRTEGVPGFIMVLLANLHNIPHTWYVPQSICRIFLLLFLQFQLQVELDTWLWIPWMCLGKYDNKDRDSIQFVWSWTFDPR